MIYPKTPTQQAQKRTQLGTSSLDLASKELSAVVNASLSNDNRSPDQIRAIVTLFEESEVSNPLECMLLSQMVSIHHHTMRLMAKANETASVTTSETVLNLANKLMRTFATQVEAFEKLKRGGHQSIKVDHVHVHEGGQAIVGNVKHPNMGG